jgi:RHS repeat-associated protein
MKTLRFLIFALLATAVVCNAQQITDPGTYYAASLGQPQTPTMLDAGITQPQYTAAAMQPQFSPMSQSNVPSTPVAETITPEIQALADGLQDDPVKIFNYVHDHIRFVLYFGSKKGANLTLLEKSGNDFDQDALLVALLRAAGYSNAAYQFGWMFVPYDSTNHLDLHHCYQLTLNNTNWTTTVSYLSDLLVTVRGYPLVYFLTDSNTVLLQRTWVTVSVGSTNYYLDPSFKDYEPVSGINLQAAMGVSSNALMTAAAGTDTGTYVTNLNEAALRGTLAGYTTNFLNYVQSNYPNASVQQLLGGWQLIPSTNTALSTSNLFSTYVWGGQMPILNWANEPTNIMSTLKITFAGTNYQWFIPQLEGQRLSLTYDSSGLAQLWQDDTLLVQKSTAASDTNVVLYVDHPVGWWDTTNNVFVDLTLFDQTTTMPYQRTNATYAILYAFEPDWGWLQERENKLDSYLQQGLTNGSRQVTSETLNVMGLNWMLQTEKSEQILASQVGMLTQCYHRFGRMAQENGKGYYVDTYMQLSGVMPSGGNDTAHLLLLNKHVDLNSYFDSAMENGLIEELQNTNLVGASTVKMLQIANTNNQAIYLANSANWTSGANVKSKLLNYDATSLNTLTSYINSGFYLLLPQNGSNHVSSATGSWAGYGYEARLTASGVIESSQMIIQGGYHGGYSSDPTAVVNTYYTDLTGVNQPTYYDGTPVYTPPSNAGDPVDMADGTFQLEATDLSVGKTEPRGITLSRYYNGTRRFSNSAGMAGGWIHNYCAAANNVASPQASLGETTPPQAASMLTAICSAVGVYNASTPSAKNWVVAALISKWGIDQLTKSGVSVNLGKDTLQFVQQPNGVFAPPANCTATLTQSGSTYSLQMRHGNTFNFNSSGLLSSIVDPYGQSVNITYNSSNLVSTVKDWQNRHTFTFNYTGKQLTSVSDGTRTVNYGYSTTYNPQGDLTSFQDAEGKTSTYNYDTNHDITATIDAQSRLVISNLYDSQGHITTQYTQGDINKMWRIFWSGWQAVAQDPAGGQQSYFYDDAGRLIEQQDALGHLSQTFYDGQNHIVMTVSPLGETNQFLYDGNNNPTNAVDALGFSTQSIYDNQNNLVKTIDPRGDVSTFGYNTQFSIIGQTNGAGDFANFAYNTDGTLQTRTDSGGATTYGYDSSGQLNSITYPNSLGSESFANNSFGDATSHTDGRGFITTFSYNNRRQLTNSVAPTNVVTTIAYDPIGNTASTTDARGNVSSNTWSATRHLLAAKLPATSQGTPIVTNIYDNRDWLIRTLDPLQSPTLYTNDIAGRITATTDPLLRTTTLGYDADGRKIAITNAAGEVTIQQWDKRGSLVKTIDGAGHTILCAFDSAGNQVTLTNRNGKVWQFKFDGANRLTNTISPLGHTATEIFNHQGKVASIKDPAGQTATYGYDGKRRLTNRTDNVGTTLYGCDANDNRTSVSESGLTNTWTYDAYNRVSSYKDVYGNLIQYSYDANNNLTNLIYPGGKNVYYSYDSENHLTQVKDWSGRTTTLTYDLAGKLASITRPNGTQRIISYDSGGQATNILEANILGFPIALFRFNWNSAAEIQWEFAAPLPHTNALPTRTMTYDDDNRLATFNGTSVASDLDGNLSSAPLTNGTFFNFTYDARNRLLNAGGVTNAYDAMNNRIGQTYGTNTTAFVVNPNSKLPEVLMRIKNGVTNYYIYGPGLLYQITETATVTNTLTYHYDCRGSTIALTDDNGNVTDRMEYSAYATMTYHAGTSDTPFLFNGLYGVQSDANGLLFMAARFYSPLLCRFINSDPTGFSGGLNFYAYANGNPISLIDPFGLSFWSVTGHFLEGAVIGAAVAVVVIVAAPEIAAAGAVALTYAGIEAATATTIASATVTAGLTVTAGVGTYSTVVNTAQSAGTASVTGNWDAVAYNAGALTGASIVGFSGGGQALAENISGQPTSASPGLFGDSALGYDRNYPDGSVLTWLGSGPTPQSGTGALIPTATGASLFFQPSGTSSSTGK